MFGICARRTILVIAMLFAFTTVGEAAPSDWSDIVDPAALRPARTPQRVATTSKAKTRATKTKKMSAPKRSAAKSKAKPRAKGKRR